MPYLICSCKSTFTNTMKYFGLLFFLFIHVKSVFMSCDLSLGGISCSCSNVSLSCVGIQTLSHDLLSSFSNISLSHIEHLHVSVENLVLNENSTLEKLELKNVTLNSGLSSLNDNLFIYITDFLISLNLQKNHFNYTPSNALHVLENLEYLDLSFNNIVSLSKNDFKGLGNLKFLQLGNNNIRIIDDGTFFPLTYLKTLKLRSNKLQKLEIVAFDNLQNLEFLDLAFNQLELLEPETFTKLTSLHTLEISHNNFLSFKNLNFSSNSLISFIASNCSLQGPISSGDLHLLPNLEILDLSFNRLNLIETFTLSSLQHLNVLNLSHNTIRQINHNAFTYLYNLTELNLEYNVLFVVRSNTFYNLTKLRSLNLSFNKLEAFICDYTSDLLSLEVIDLRSNQIKTIQAGTFIYSKDVREIKLQGNILDCSCSISEFVISLNNNTNLNKSDISSVTCASPSAFVGQPINNIDYSSMTCPVSRICDSPTLTSTDDDYDDTTHSIITRAQSTTITSTSKTLSSNTTYITFEIPRNSTTEDTTLPINITVTTENQSTNFINVTDSNVNYTTEFTSNLSTEFTNTDNPHSSTFLKENTTFTNTETSFSFSTTLNFNDSLQSSTLTSSSYSFRNDTITTISPNDTTTISPNDTTTISPIGTLGIFLKNHSYFDGKLCLEWMMSGAMPTERLQCILLYTYSSSSISSSHDSHRKLRFNCPKLSNEVKQECHKIFKVDTLHQFCIRVYKQMTKELLIDSCAISNVETTTEKLRNSTEVVTEALLMNTVTSTMSSPLTTLFSTSFPSSTSKFLKLIEYTSISTDNSLFNTKFPTVIAPALKPFNFTYITFTFLNETSLNVKWKVERTEPSFTCQLSLRIFNDKYNHTNASLLCKDGSYVAVGLEKSVDYHLCFLAIHTTYGRISKCIYIPNPKQDFSVSNSNSDYSFTTLPIIVLIGLLVVIMLIVVVLAVRSMMRSPRARDHYNVSIEEKKVQKRERLNSTTPSVRYSYTVNEELGEF